MRDRTNDRRSKRRKRTHLRLWLLLKHTTLDAIRLTPKRGTLRNSEVKMAGILATTVSNGINVVHLFPN
jgi:hypothetical protein